MGARTHIHPLQRGSHIQQHISRLGSHGKRHQEAACVEGVDVGTGRERRDTSDFSTRL